MNTQNPAQQNNHVSEHPLIEGIVGILSNPEMTFLKDKLLAAGISEQTAATLINIKDAVKAHQISQNKENIKLAKRTLQSGEETFQTISKIKTGLNNSIQSSGRIQTITAIMYLMTFLLGFFLVITGAYFTGIQGKNDWFTAAFGVSGFVLILATFIAKPPRELQRVRSNYVQLSILSLGWLNELIDNSGYRNSSLNDGSLDITKKVELHKQLVEEQNETTQKYLRMLENYAEPKEEKDNADLLTLNQEITLLKGKLAEAAEKK